MKSKTTAALGVLAVLALLAASSAPATAGQAGDDAVMCCSSLNSGGTTTASGFTPQALGCIALDGSLKSINSCGAIVLGCAESGFSCVPSQTSAGKKDCSCGPLILNQAF
ncbi:MAG TPA: hypothetical protein VFE56_05890 [Candidatus Binataceae bacterium]|jgi:hypothetical protein|nr:hypothetical protein [Candidatus Binataceae bacterium]